MPSSSSPVGCAHMFVLPLYSHEGRSSTGSTPQVSTPNWFSSGMVWKVQSCSPVRTSKPRTSPRGASLVAGIWLLRRSAMNEPTITTSRTMVGAEFQ